MKYDYKYNYVFYGVNEDYYLPTLGTFDGFDNVRVLKSGIASKCKLTGMLFRFHWSRKMNSIINLPLRKLWYKRMYGKDFDNNKPTCFVFLGAQYAWQDGCAYLHYIMKRNPNNKTVVMFWDLIKMPKDKRKLLFANVDLATTFDRHEADNVGITFYEENIYEPLEETTEPTTFDSDIYFLGYPKGRHSQIVEIYRELTAAGLRCDFNFVGVSQDEKVNLPGIHYCSQLPYAEYVKKIQTTKCLLEVLQPGAEAETLRALEAVAYKRKLMTNFKGIVDKPYYNANQMRLFNSTDEIDPDFIREGNRYESFAVNELIAPEQRLRYFEEMLS